MKLSDISSDVKKGVSEISDVNELLSRLQRELKVPKGRYNAFSKFNYRSCEDILEAVKKLLPEGATLIISDTIEMIGRRYYVKAIAMLSYKREWTSSCAYAREALTKKGMDDAQITGSVSSYARKYALNGLFLIDDSKDEIDSVDNRNNQEDIKQALRLQNLSKAERYLEMLDISLEKVSEALKIDTIKHLEDLSNENLEKLIKGLRKKSQQSQEIV